MKKSSDILTSSKWYGTFKIEKGIRQFLSIVFDLERTNRLSLLPDKDLVDLCHPIKPY